MVFMDIDLGPLAPAHLSEVIVGAVLAILVAVGVQKLVVPRFEQLFIERSEQIEGSINRAQLVQAEADRTKREFEEKLAASQQDAVEIREAARQQGEQIIAEAKVRAQNEYDRLLDQAQQQIEVERAQAFASLKGEIGLLAAQLAERIIGEQLASPDRVQHTVDRFLADLENEPPRTAPDYPSQLLGETRQ